jgi:hypothetical protein
MGLCRVVGSKIVVHCETGYADASFFAKLISDETRKWGNVILAANIKAP